jgi:hypothetical protein
MTIEVLRRGQFYLKLSRMRYVTQAHECPTLRICLRDVTILDCMRLELARFVRSQCHESQRSDLRRDSIGNRSGGTTKNTVTELLHGYLNIRLI